MDSLACFVKAQRLHWGYLIKYSNFFFSNPALPNHIPHLVSLLQHLLMHNPQYLVL